MKYEIIGREGRYLRIKALIDIPCHGVKAGDLGGLIQSGKNLSNVGNCWIHKNSIVVGDKTVVGDIYYK